MTYEEIRDKLGWDPMNMSSEEFSEGISEWQFDGKMKYTLDVLTKQESDFLCAYLIEHQNEMKAECELKAKTLN